VYPGTPYYDEAKRVDGAYRYEFAGDALYGEDVDLNLDAQYYKGKSGEYRSYVWTDYLTAGRLVELRDAVESEVRAKLGIPYQQGAAALMYEHSMGQSIPASILRSGK
jgi:hypothetical protein